MPFAERRTAFADEGKRHTPAIVTRERHGDPRDGERADRERRGRRKDAPLPVADVQVTTVHRRAGLGHLSVEDHSYRLRPWAHCERHAEIADERAHDVALPSAVGIAPVWAALQPNRSRVDRLLAERSEALSLEGIPLYAISPLAKNCFSRRSTARVRIIPRRISRRSSSLSEAAIASRIRKPSHAPTSSSRAACRRSAALTPGVVSGSRSP